MRVKSRMTPNPITAHLKTNYNEALHLMEENHVQHLPIVDGKGRPVGIVTRADMLRAAPSPVTSLNVFEMAAFLDKVSMESIMTSPVLAVDEACSITNAASFMVTHRVNSLLVMRDEALVGIITITDIFRAFIDITGGGQPGTRIEARLPNARGHLAPFIQALSNAGSYIVSLSLSSNDDVDFGYWDVKERGGNEADIRKELDALGYVEILSSRHSDSDQLMTFGKG